jgi:hypothetical protein
MLVAYFVEEFAHRLGASCLHALVAPANRSHGFLIVASFPIQIRQSRIDRLDGYCIHAPRLGGPKPHVKPPPPYPSDPDARSYCALNSHPMSASTAIRYIHTSSAMPAPTDPYITL